MISVEDEVVSVLLFLVTPRALAPGFPLSCDLSLLNLQLVLCLRQAGRMRAQRQSIRPSRLAPPEEQRRVSTHLRRRGPVDAAREPGEGAVNRGTAAPGSRGTQSQRPPAAVGAAGGWMRPRQLGPSVWAVGSQPLAFQQVWGAERSATQP